MSSSTLQNIENSSKPDKKSLSVQILAGYAWASTSCPGAELLGKTDDNVVLDLARLQLLGAAPLPRPAVFCGTGTAHRNMKPLRSAKNHMTGNWSIRQTHQHSSDRGRRTDVVIGFELI